MRNFVFIAALCAAFSLAARAQDSSSSSSSSSQSSQPQQQESSSQSQQPDKPKEPDKPALEKPGTAAPEPEAAAPKKPAPKNPAAAGAKKPGEKPVELTNSNTRTVEEIIARVNNEIITRSELQKAEASADEDARQECQGKCTPEQLKTDIEDRRKNALRDLIDQSLLVQRGKDMGVNVEPEVIKRLDQIRQQNKIDSMEDLEKAVSGQGQNWEDFKDGIRKQILTQRVIGQEVGSHITVTHEEIAKYYDEHKAEFVRPEQVGLREIEVNTQGKPESDLPELKKKAETALKRVKDGEDFGEIAKRFSDASTAKQGGFLGVYKRGELSKELEDIVFKMKKNDLTDVMETKQGYLVLQVIERYEPGQQPLDKVENEIMDHIYSQRMEPAMKNYLKTLREQSYVIIKPGYQDIAGGGNSEIQEVSAVPEASKNKKGHKKFLLFGKRSATASSGQS